MILTPDFARALLALHTDPIQRQPEPERIRHFRQLMAEGRFAPTPGICFYVRDGGRLESHNGQHRLGGVAEGDGPVEIELTLHGDECPLRRSEVDIR